MKVLGAILILLVFVFVICLPFLFAWTIYVYYFLVPKSLKSISNSLERIESKLNEINDRDKYQFRRYSQEHKEI